jgi:ATP-dependent RNA helicase SUPV3L1/SUV3
MNRFVDRRTSALLKALNSDEDAPAEIGPAGEVLIGGHPVGHLEGLVFHAEAAGETLAGRALRGAALKSLRPIIEQRLIAIANAPDADLSFDAAKAAVVYAGAPVAKLVAAADWHSPTLELMGAREASTGGREGAIARLVSWFVGHSKATLPALHDLRTVLDGATLRGGARGAAYQLLESGAAFDRRHGAHAFELSADDRTALNAAGVKTGRIATWLPGLLKPSAARLALALRAVHSGKKASAIPTQSSFPLKDGAWTDAMLNTAGYLRLGPRAVRADLAELLASALSQIRRASEASTFAVPPELAAQVGCPTADFPAILRALGLKPAEKDKDTGAVKLWRFPAQRQHERHLRKPEQPARPQPPPTGPFAVLAELFVAQPASAPNRRRRRPRRPQAAPAPKAAS